MDIKLNPGYTKIQQLGNGGNIELSGCCALSLIQVIEFRSALRKQILKIMVVQQFIHKTKKSSLIWNPKTARWRIRIKSLRVDYFFAEPKIPLFNFISFVKLFIDQYINYNIWSLLCIIFVTVFLEIHGFWVACLNDQCSYMQLFTKSIQWVIL